MDFQWDENKNQANIQKHGFDFTDAWEIFEYSSSHIREVQEFLVFGNA